MDRTVVLVALVLISTLAAACAGPSAAAPSSAKPAASGAQAVEVKATDMMKFEPATITVKRGTPVRLTLTNDGALEHNWVVDNLDGRKVQVDARSKARATGEFMPIASGTYEFYGSVLGHREAGMKGTLVIQ
jgi:plastocyanin